MSLWEEIISIYDKQDCNNIIIVRDLNTSLLCPDSILIQYLDHALRVENLKMCINSKRSSIVFTFIKPVNSLYPLVPKYIRMHGGDNVSFRPAANNLELNIEL